MRFNHKLLLIAPLLMAAISCTKVEKDPLDYYPKVETVSAVVLDDGSVQVTGQIIDEGADAIEYGGFCMDTLSNPKMMSKQIIATNSGGTFTAIYENFDITKTYYFRSWAANGYGYAYGNVIALDSIEAEPVIPTCTPPQNSMNYGGGTGTQYFTDVTTPTPGLDGWEV